MQLLSQLPANSRLIELSKRYKLLEFQLWDSLLSFRCPAATLNRKESEDKTNYYVDERPFVNTKSRIKYTEISTDYSFLNIYRTGWNIAHYPFKIKKLGELHFCVQLFFISESGIRSYSDIQDHECLTSWISEEKKQYTYRMARLNMTDAGNGFFKIDPRSHNPQSPAAIDCEMSHDVLLKTKYLGTNEKSEKIKLFYEHSHFNSVHFYLCFSNREFVRFTFEIDFIETRKQKDIQALQQRAEHTLSIIMSSLSFMQGVIDIK